MEYSYLPKQESDFSLKFNCRTFWSSLEATVFLLPCASPHPNNRPSSELLNHQNTESAATFIASEDNWKSQEKILYCENFESDFLTKEIEI